MLENNHGTLILRYWSEGQSVTGSWRFMIEEIGANKRYGFTSPHDLLAFLQQQFNIGSLTIHSLRPQGDTHENES